MHLSGGSSAEWMTEGNQGGFLLLFKGTAIPNFPTEKSTKGPFNVFSISLIKCSI